MTAPAWAAVALEQEATVTMGGGVGAVVMCGIPLGGGVLVEGRISPRRKKEDHGGPRSCVRNRLPRDGSPLMKWRGTLLFAAAGRTETRYDAGDACAAAW